MHLLIGYTCFVIHGRHKQTKEHPNRWKALLSLSTLNAGHTVSPYAINQRIMRMSKAYLFEYLATRGCSVRSHASISEVGTSETFDTSEWGREIKNSEIRAARAWAKELTVAWRTIRASSTHWSNLSATWPPVSEVFHSPILSEYGLSIRWTMKPGWGSR